MNMGSLESQLMNSFKDMDAKEKEKEQKEVDRSVTKEQVEHEEKKKKRWAVKFGPKLRRRKRKELKWQRLVVEIIDD